MGQVCICSPELQESKYHKFNVGSRISENVGKAPPVPQPYDSQISLKTKSIPRSLVPSLGIPSQIKLPNLSYTEEAAKKTLKNSFPKGQMSLSTTSVFPSEMSFSTYDWVNKGGDGLEVTKVMSREQCGMLALKAMDANGVDVKDLNTHGGRSALMFAVISDDFEFVKRLVNNGADLTEQTADGETALSLAKSLSSPKIYNFLLNYEV